MEGYLITMETINWCQQGRLKYVGIFRSMAPLEEERSPRQRIYDKLEGLYEHFTITPLPNPRWVCKPTNVQWAHFYVGVHKMNKKDTLNPCRQDPLENDDQQEESHATGTNLSPSVFPQEVT